MILIGLAVVTTYCVAYYDPSKGFGAFERYVRRRNNGLVFFKSESWTFLAVVGLLILAIRKSFIGCDRG